MSGRGHVNIIEKQASIIAHPNHPVHPSEFRPIRHPSLFNLLILKILSILSNKKIKRRLDRNYKIIKIIPVPRSLKSEGGSLRSFIASLKDICYNREVKAGYPYCMGPRPNLIEATVHKHAKQKILSILSNKI